MNDNRSVAETERQTDREARRDDLEGALLTHYRIVEHLGSGGTGNVYEAEDTELQRRVAVKVLSPAVTSDPSARARLVQEARAATTLNHRNIGAVYSIEETHDGRIFIVMALYSGASLERRLRQGPLSEESALSIARQAAAGLAHAHDRGIVHCDVKPANILVTHEGLVKVLDFGLARLVGQLDSVEPTRITGTIHYMSPEQVSGKAVDARSDVWSLGVVLYEMLAGRRPFHAARRADVVDSVLHDDPLPLIAVHAETNRLVEKTLLRRAATRPSMKEVGADIADILFASRPGLRTDVARDPEEKSVLVLAFVSLERRDEDDLFARGLTEAVIADLSLVKGLRVVSRAAGAGVNASSSRIREACRDMNVEFVLEGDVQRDDAGGFAISARLVETRTDFLAWSAHTDARHVLRTRATLSAGIAGAVGLH
jgi:eukaryotic-like serine/threonine-protein kinase